MSSPLYSDDVECIRAVASSPEAADTRQKSPPKPSFLRKWGPALAAVAGALAVNAALLGPTGSRVPALSPEQIRGRELRMERTRAVLDMEWDHAADVKRGVSNMHGSRNLSEAEGGVMEYTRRRHR